ncbi:MAG: ABC transporter substrate-binding protein [Desulfobacteraceae bacterium]|nr:MAG: ABC transporter substrate-binding protein [Desulfobacteraceae bacterium]
MIGMALLAVWGCQNQEPEQKTEAAVKETVQEHAPAKEQGQQRQYDPMPNNINWLTNNDDPVFSSPKAQKGGVFKDYILSFPMTFRLVGPDSNGSFASHLRANFMSLINLHPNTDNIIPELATHWAFDDDKKTMYFKLDKAARWSDGEPVTAWDYAYTLTFMRSKHIIAPFYNDYYTREIDTVFVYDDYTIGIRATKAVPDLHLHVALDPTPEHFFKPLGSDFVQKYNWEIHPNTGPYQISDFKKGKYVKFKRKKAWWAKDHRYFKNRFNVDLVVLDVVRDFNMSWEFFKKGKIDTFPLTFPDYWHTKSDIDIFNNGYTQKIWYYYDNPQSAQGMWLNCDKPMFSDINLRYAFAHAMNVEKVIQGVLRNDYLRLPQAFYGYGEYTNEAVRPRTYNIDRVGELMTDSGWNRGKDGIWAKGGQRFSVEVTYGFEGHTPRLVVLKEEAAKAGIELRLQKLDSTASFKKFLEKNHDVAWMGWSTNLRPSYWQGWHSDNAHKPQTNNITNTDNKVLDKLIDQYRDSLEAEERIALSMKIQPLIHDTGAFVPTFMVPYVRQGYWRWLRLPEFHGTKRSENLFSPFGTSTGGVFWVDDAVKKETLGAMKSKQTFEPVVIKDDKYMPKAIVK